MHTNFIHLDNYSINRECIARIDYRRLTVQMDNGDLICLTQNDVEKIKTAVYYVAPKPESVEITVVDKTKAELKIIQEYITKYYGSIAVNGDFRYEFDLAHKTGNITPETKIEHGLIKTIEEISIDLGGGRIQTTKTVTDHLCQIVSKEVFDKLSSNIFEK